MFFTQFNQLMAGSVDITLVIRKSATGMTVSVLPKSNGLKDEAQNHIVPLMEKPNKFDPFGQKESAHLIYHTIAPLKVLVMGVNFILPF